MKLLLVFLLFPQLSLAMSMAVTQVVASRQPLYEELVRSLGPVAYWRLGEQSGTNANDDTAGLHDGTYTNTPTLGADPLLTNHGGTSVSFASASSEFADVADAAGDLAPKAESTLLAWFNTSTDANDYIAAKFQAVNGFQWIVFGTDVDEVRVFYDNSSATGLNATSDVIDGVTHFSAVTLSGGTGRIYVDGVEESSASLPTPAPNNLNFTIGARTDNTSHFNGRLGHITLFDYALTAGQVDMLWRLGSGRQVSPGDSW